MVVMVVVMVMSKVGITMRADDDVMKRIMRTVWQWLVTKMVVLTRKNTIVM